MSGKIRDRGDATDSCPTPGSDQSFGGGQRLILIAVHSFVARTQTVTAVHVMGEPYRMFAGLADKSTLTKNRRRRCRGVLQECILYIIYV